MTRNALIVASDQYSDPRLRQLRAPAMDVRALTDVLRDPAIGGFEVRSLLNEPAHRVNYALDEFFADRGADDLLLVHFSGHGIKDEDGELYLAAPDTELGRLDATAVSAAFISRKMTRGRSRRVVLLLDCCYAGAFERGLVARADMSSVGVEQQFDGRARVVITASSAMEYAFEAGELADASEMGPSVFTSALVEGLATGDADRDQDGLIGLDELYGYVYDKVRAATPNQTPGKWVFGMQGDLVIARRSRPVTTPSPLPADLQKAIRNPLPEVRVTAVQELAKILHGRHLGLALAAQLALEQLTKDDSDMAAAATAALSVLDQKESDPPAADTLPVFTENAPSAAGPDTGQARTGSGADRTASRRDDHPPAATSAPGGRSRREGRIRWRRLAIAGIGIALVSLIVVLTPIIHKPAIKKPPTYTTSTRWTYKTGGSTLPSPVVSGDVVYATGLDKIYALNTDTGRLLKVFSIGNRIISGPTMARAIIYVCSDSDELYAVNAVTSRILWTYDTGGDVAAGALASNGNVYVGSNDGKIYSLDATTGHLRWTYTTGGSITSKPTEENGTIYVGSHDGKLYALNSVTGRLRWTYATGALITSGPTVSNSRVYVGNNGRKVYDIDASTGHLRWSHTIGGSVFSGPTISGNTVYVGGLDNKVYALDATTGQLLWTYTTNGSPTGVLIEGGLLYVGGYNQRTLYVLDAATGNPLWAYATRGPITSSPAEVDRTVYIGSNVGIYALKAKP